MRCCMHSSSRDSRNASGLTAPRDAASQPALRVLRSTESPWLNTQDQGHSRCTWVTVMLIPGAGCHSGPEQISSSSWMAVVMTDGSMWKITFGWQPEQSHGRDDEPDVPRTGCGLGEPPSRRQAQAPPAADGASLSCRRISRPGWLSQAWLQGRCYRRRREHSLHVSQRHHRNLAQQTAQKADCC